MIVFHSLEKEHLKEIVSMMANALTKRLKEQDISLELTDAALEKIAQEAMILNTAPARYAVHYKNKWKTAYQKNY